MSTYKPTGYKPGRPRNGEIRPLSPNAEAKRRYRKKRLEREPEWRAVLAAEQANWRANNLERSREISRNTYRRKQNIQTTEAIKVYDFSGNELVKTL